MGNCISRTHGVSASMRKPSGRASLMGGSRGIALRAAWVGNSGDSEGMMSNVGTSKGDIVISLWDVG